MGGDNEPPTKKRRTNGHEKRQATVYDAVAGKPTPPAILSFPPPLPASLTPLAGRVNYSRFIPAQPGTSSTRDTTSTSQTAVPPDEVLFRRKHAPARYHERDIYYANEKEVLPLPLPDSDLLKAVHTYAADFYARLATVTAAAAGSSNSRSTKRLGVGKRKGNTGDWRSLDETALLAVGVLLEESFVQVLGETGDLVFVEGQEEQEQGRNPESEPVGEVVIGGQVEAEGRSES